jgi:hypothetical protein
MQVTAFKGLYGSIKALLRPYEGFIEDLLRPY